MEFTRWTIGPTLAAYLRELLRPGMRTLECGSGLSTRIFLDAGCDHIALEDDPKYRFEHPCVVVAPLIGKPPWYATWPRGPFDLILIDRPSAARGGRWGFLRAARDLIGPDTILILDDTQRKSDRELAGTIAKAFGMRKETIVPQHPKDFGRSATILHPGAARLARVREAEHRLRRILNVRPGYAKIDTFVETGTWLADTTLAACRLFRWVETIELSYDLYAAAKRKLANSQAILHFGDSAQIIPLIAKRLDRPVCWYLDAHWFREQSPYGPPASESPFPLWKELEAIKLRRHADIVIVDDVHAFGRDSPGFEPWKTVSPSTISLALKPRVIASATLGDQFVCWLSDDGASR